MKHTQTTHTHTHTHTHTQVLNKDKRDCTCGAHSSARMLKTPAVFQLHSHTGLTRTPRHASDLRGCILSRLRASILLIPKNQNGTEIRLRDFEPEDCGYINGRDCHCFDLRLDCSGRDQHNTKRGRQCHPQRSSQ